MANQATQDEVKAKLIVLIASPEYGGSISHACKAMGWSRQTILDWRKADPVFDGKLRAAVIQGKEELAGMAERALVKRIEEGDTTSIIFTLKSLNRRFYGTTEEMLANVEADTQQEARQDGLGAHRVRSLHDAQLLLKILIVHTKYQFSKAKLPGEDSEKLATLMDRLANSVQDDVKTPSSL